MDCSTNHTAALRLVTNAAYYARPEVRLSKNANAVMNRAKHIERSRADARRWSAIHRTEHPDLVRAAYLRQAPKKVARRKAAYSAKVAKGFLPISSTYQGEFIVRAVAEVTGCWRWTGTLTVDGRVQSQSVRRIYKRLRADIPPHCEIHHACLNHECVNPWHILVLPRLEHLALHAETGGIQMARNARIALLEGDLSRLVTERQLEAERLVNRDWQQEERDAIKEAESNPA